MFRICRQLTVSLVALVSLLLVQPALAKLDVGLQVKLQTTMQLYVDERSEAGDFLVISSETGDFMRLQAKAAHPHIFKGEDFYILCYDFLDAHGDEVNIDFYIRATAERYSVYHVEVESHELLEELLDNDRVAVLH